MRVLPGAVVTPRAVEVERHRDADGAGDPRPFARGHLLDGGGSDGFAPRLNVLTGLDHSPVADVSLTALRGRAADDGEVDDFHAASRRCPRPDPARPVRYRVTCRRHSPSRSAMTRPD